ncbi:MAG: penicillin-binding protein 2 [Verrucomicrobia bacterium]|nr:penicillin-binding protein 2 [Verrucomicrobiota bacterium]
MARAKKTTALDFRLLFLAGFFLVTIAGLTFRLWFLQVPLHDYYQGRIQGNSEVTVRIPSIRGEIRDRNGLPLVTNRPSYEVDFYLPDLVSGYKKQYGKPPMIDFRAKDASGMLHDRKEPDIVEIVDRTIIPRLEELKVAEPYNSQRLRTHYRNNTLVPFTYREDLDFGTFSKFAEKDLGLPGVQVNVRPVRKYVYSALAGQILGYVGAPRDINKLPDIRDFNFYEPDVQGRTNIEYFMDDELRGKPGRRVLKKNAKNQLEGEKEVIRPTPGANVYLTIDARIQYIVERALRVVGRAACVVVDPNNGQILAMASIPSYDPNKFIPSISARDWAALKDAEADPLTNRAISAFAPGSTYKIATALAGLTKGLAKAQYTCSGGVTYGNTYMKCWIAEKGGAHGTQTLTEAIKNSCNAYFYQYGNTAGIDAIDKVGETLGLGQSSGIELSGEDPGILPSPEWLKINKNEKWSQGQTANTSIGQGYVLASPLQMAMIAATVANGGTVYKPSLIYQVQEAGGTIARRPAKVRGDLLRDNDLTKDQIEMVRKGMWRVVNDAGGTGAKARVAGITVAGKTGTAQFWRDGKKDNHTWFIAFAPYENPKIALAVLVQGAKAGGQVPAPVAAKIIEEVLALDKGYNPGVQPVEPAVGNFKFVESINFKENNVPAQLAPADDETSDDMPEPDPEPTPHRRSVSKSQAAEPDIRPEADAHINNPPRALAPQPERRHNFFDFFRRKPKEAPSTQQPAPEEKKKKRFFFF